jgi:hypothetical protein
MSQPSGHSRGTDYSRIARRIPLAAFIALLFAASTYADDLHQIFVSPGFNNPQSVYNAWTPLRLTLTNRSDRDPTTQLVVAEVPGPNGPFEIQIAVSVPHRTRFTTLLLLPPAPPQRTENPPIFRWQISGANVAQTDLLQYQSPHSDDAERRTTILNLAGDEFEEDSSADFSTFAKTLSDITGTTTIPWRAQLTHALRNPAGYDSCRLVALAGGSPQILDPLQRRALLEFVRAGGTLLVCDPTPQVSWLDRYLPVSLIGSRLANQIGAVPLKNPQQICEAILTRGQAVLSDGSFVHAAYAPLGLGRISFISFPITSLTLDQATSRRLWSDLLGLAALDPSWSASDLPARQNVIIGQMIGTPVPSRGVAFVLAIGFAAFVLVAQLIWRAANRPFGYVISSLGALAGSPVFLILGFAHQQSAPLTAAAVDVAHLSDSGGFVQEFAAFTGRSSNPQLTTTIWQSTLRPSAYDDSHPPILCLAPFSAPDAGAAPRRVDRIWEASSPVSAETSASAYAMFDQNGLNLSVNNQINSPLSNPLLIYGASVYPLKSLPIGVSKTTLSARPAHSQSDPFVNAGAIIDESDILRAQILRSLLAIPQTSDTPADISSRAWIAGWTDSEPSLIASSVQPAIQRSLKLAIFPFFFHPSPPDSLIQIDSGFNEILIKTGSIPIYDSWKGAWVGCNQGGLWEIGIRPPRAIGPANWTRATLHASIELPMQAMTICHQQVHDGTVEINPAGAEIATWSNTFGSQPAVSFNLSSNDIDRNGTLWLLAKVDSPSDAASAHSWQFTDFGVDLFGQTPSENH